MIGILLPFTLRNLTACGADIENFLKKLFMNKGMARKEKKEEEFNAYNDEDEKKEDDSADKDDEDEFEDKGEEDDSDEEE